MLALTVKQPTASLIVAGVEDVVNSTWALPTSLTRWWVCSACGERLGKTGAGGVDLHVHGVRLHEAQLGGPCPFRMMIHAAKDTDWDALRALPPRHGGLVFHTGVLLGSVTVTGCHHADECGCSCGGRRWTDDENWTPERPREWNGERHPGDGRIPCGLCNHGGWDEDDIDRVNTCSPWAQPDAWHWTLADPEPLPEPIPVRGRAGLWRLPADLRVGVPA